MKKRTLLVLAAGMGSRYGGLKQIDPVGPAGETIIDYSVYDAIRAGFDQLVFVIRRDIEQAFRETIGDRFEKRITDTALGTVRSLESIVQGFEERVTGLERDIRDSQKRAGEFEAKVGAPFEHEKRYHHLTQRQAEIEEKLDLTKNQASSQVEDAASDETEEKISQQQTQTKANRQPQRNAARV